MAARPTMRLLRLQGYPVLEQLKLEERLLRTSSANWCLLNDGTAPPSVVMGISGKPELLLDVKSVVHHQIPVIRRFSGGGTVVVDEGTIFATLICSREANPGLQLYPRQIMHWMEQLYNSVFPSVLEFRLREHDFVSGKMKFGGNAQSIIKDRWLHHTSFLWDYQASRMSYLKIPDRHPTYRQARHHEEFLCRMQDFMPSRGHFFDAFTSALQQRFDLKEIAVNQIVLGSGKPYPQSTTLIDLEELQHETREATIPPVLAS